jgi:hypothetical protein
MPDSSRSSAATQGRPVYYYGGVRIGGCRPRPVAHDDVVQKPDIDERQRFLDSLSDHLVRLARIGDSRRMIVSHDHRGRVLLQRELHDFARMHARPVDRAPK